MQKRAIKQHDTFLAELKKLEDLIRELIISIENAMQTNDEEKVLSLYSELNAIQKTQRQVLAQAEAYRDMLLAKQKRSTEQQRLKQIVN